MNDPIKIIWKFKNNNRRTQFHTYIFVGNINPDIMAILRKIEDFNLYDALSQLHKTEYKKLEAFYGQRWYAHFYNTYHIDATMRMLRDSSLQKQELADKHGDEWVTNHVASYTPVQKKLIYSYESLVKDERSRKTIKKGRATAVATDDDVDIDYSTTKKIDLKKIFGKQQSRTVSHTTDFNVNYLNSLDDVEIEPSTAHSSNDEASVKSISENSLYSDTANSLYSDSEDSDTTSSYSSYNSDDSDDSYDSQKQYIQHGGNNDDNDADSDVDMLDGDEQNNSYENEGLDRDELLKDEEVDMDEIEQMYKDVDVNPDDNLTETTSMIRKALNDDNIFEKKIGLMVEFDQSKDTNMYDENLKDVYKKYYVVSQYIFKDDTIKSVKDKICCGMKMNKKFDDDAYLIPSRQYLWSKYFFGENEEIIMIGQKWMKRNEVLKIDVEPNNNMRIYEELRGPLKYLKENIRRQNNKIRREDDENNILFDYDEYITNNEIYMIDLYNEFGLNYAPDADAQRNIQDVYLKLYFPRMKTDDLKYIIDYLSGDKKAETGKIESVFYTINNDLTLENEITKLVEDVKANDKYQYIFKDNYITQSVIHVNLRMRDNTKVDLFRIFNEFSVNETYPFVQYQSTDGIISYKLNGQEINISMKKKGSDDVIMKWFENAPYGISFKVKIFDKNGERFMAINLNETGRIEYKTQWKEEDMATIDDIKHTYSYVKLLIEKINKEKNRVIMEIPDDSEFKYAFINTIQKFEFPENFTINHNDLSDFSRNFYPYVSLVIDPRKRQAKVQKGEDKSKFGTYLRYKRVSKYENQARVEQRIMYFIRNFEFTEQSLANEISKQFNITISKALEEYERVRSRYPNLKKSRKVLKKLENIPKYKPPGIGIDVQGKQRDKYKIRISGARYKLQLESIITFMNVLTYLYVDTYLYKKPERQILKEKLKKLTNIAKRRSKVDDIVRDQKDNKSSVKQMTQFDKRRIGFKPEKGQNQWTRSCQNSGDDKKRRPQQYVSNNMEELLKKGYYFNKKAGQYEKKVVQKEKGKKIEITLKTVKVSELDDDGNMTGNEIHYTCNPEENGDHYFVGFLTRSMNPNGHCMPCCFKKDPMTSKNKEKQEFFKQCLGHGNKEVEQPGQKLLGDKLYILQDTNKISEGRYGFLPKYLDIYFNFMLGKQKTIKHHYLAKTSTGYFFKSGSKQEEYQFINAFCSMVDLTLDQIRDKMFKALDNDKSNQIFTSLNTGDIKTQFGSRDVYIKYIKESEFLSYDKTNNLLSIPGVITKNGVNIVMFHKQVTIIRKTFEKEKIREDFILKCQNIENVNCLQSLSRDTLFMIKENKNFYPIVMVMKESETTKEVKIIKMFKFSKEKDNIVNHVNDWFVKNCEGSFVDSLVYKTASLTAQMTRHILDNMKNSDYVVKSQIVDVRNKCRSLITASGLIIPVRPSGSLYDVTISKNIAKHISNYTTTFKNLTDVYELSQKQLPIKPIGVYYDGKNGDKINVNAIMTKTNDIVVVEPIEMSIKKLESDGLLYEDKPLSDKVDAEISKGKSNYIIDNRMIDVNKDVYQNESYELFRLEFSEYINKPEHAILKNRIEDLMNNLDLQKKEKTEKIKLVLFKLVDKDLYNIYKKLLEKQNKKVDEILSDEEIGPMLQEPDDVQTGGKYTKLLHITTKVPNYEGYKISNDREICMDIGTKDKCNINPHCHWTHGGCLMSLSKELIIMFINKISEELSENDLKSFEILRIGNYFVSDIVDFERFTERDGQQIIRSTSHNIKKTLHEMFGKEYIPKIGRKKTTKNGDINYQQLNDLNPLIDLRDVYVQKLIENNLTIFRAYVNGYYWLRNKLNDVDSKNLGYYNLVQTDLANYFRSLVVDWLQDPKNQKIIVKSVLQYMDIKKSSKDSIKDFTIKLARDVPTLTNCIVELYILSKINKTPVVVYDDNLTPIYIFDDEFKYDARTTPKLPDDLKHYVSVKERKQMINLRFAFVSNNKIPDLIDVLYFK
jgi:hypothetical protein